MNSRETILSAIRRNLGVSVHRDLPMRVKSPESVMPDIAVILERFQLESRRVGTEVIYVASHNEAIEAIVGLLMSGNIQNVMVSTDSLLNHHQYYGEMKKKTPASLLLELFSGERADRIQSLNASVVAAWGGVAETGSVIFLSSADQPRAIILLPELLFVVVRVSTLASDMEGMVDRIQQRKIFDGSSCVTCVTGPSRTSDIEKILVKGVHGPTRVVVLLIAD